MSLLMQFVASVLWAVGALIAGPSSLADYLQFFAAVAWIVSNVFAATSLRDSKTKSAAVIQKSKVVEMNKV